MPNYLAPDVYVEEVPGGPRPIEAVGTSTAAFIGAAPDADALTQGIRAVTNWSEFQRLYAAQGQAGTDLSQAVFGFFQNGGQRCYVVNTGPARDLGAALNLVAQRDDVAIVAAPGFTDAASYDALLTHCETLGDRVAILDAPRDVPDVMALTRVARPVPAVRAGADTSTREGAERDGPGRPPPGELDGLRPRQSDNGYGALYFPWLRVRDPGNPAELIDVPPSGHMAGIWARTDAMRGVHKAPANEAVRGALDLSYHLTRAEQEQLNSHGVNCVRFFSSEGVRVWGARTVAASASEFRYLNVRRLFNMIKESIALSTRWIVFEPNDETLWKSIRRDVNAFLLRLWRDGALMGRTPQEAFFVKCDRETNPPEVIDAGQVVTLIGVAPVKPAEFIVFRLSQMDQRSDTQGPGE
ncbi:MULTISPECIES: phage tail sheath family protein [Deinococcus]|uniref:Phage tail sheath family protein n=1 Tax=Deinococcus rufus TaxID=2136097 RepID=A0ABV7Z3G4_9DEIO|nr:phage tail sheath C-terminal domain-containing protein [Deinococcus sp. AB2017081]WQE95842.1 phage tail sheath subtilisin-like domain-containing protein [Deinococcus sp. AB2017081]